METPEQLTDGSLRRIDKGQVDAGKPILSVLIVLDDGSLCAVARESIKKYNLAKPGESDDEVAKRLRAEAYAYYADH